MILHRHIRLDHHINRLVRCAVDVDAAAAQLFQRGADGFVARERPRSGAGLADDAPDVLGARGVKRSVEFAGNRRPRRQPARKRANIVKMD
jgi:hypothetical protein